MLKLESIAALLVVVVPLACGRGEPPAAGPSAAAGLAGLRQILADQLGIDPEAVEISKTFADLGADELDLVETTIEVEERFRIAIDDDKLIKAAGVAKVEDLPGRLTVAKFLEVVSASRAAPADRTPTPKR